MKIKNISVNLEIVQVTDTNDTGHYEAKISYTLSKPNKLKEIDKRDITYHAKVEKLMGYKATYSETLGCLVYLISFGEYYNFMVKYTATLPHLLGYVEQSFKN